MRNLNLFQDQFSFKKEGKAQKISTQHLVTP